MNSKTGVLVFLIVILLAILPMSIAELAITPFEVDLTLSYKTLNSNVFTIMNTGVEKVSIQAEVDEYSDYLRGSVTIKPELFTLEPGAKQNVLVESKFSDRLSPEKHDLIINLIDTKKGETQSSFNLFFSIDGEQIQNLLLNDAKIIQKSDGSLSLEVLAENKGNIMARGVPKVIITQNGNTMNAEVRGQFRVLPGEEKKIIFPIDASLSAGTYSATTSLEYGIKKTNPVDCEFVFEPIEFFKTNSKKEIKQGEIFTITLSLRNNESFESPYKIEANVNGTDIKDLLAGKIPPEEQANFTLLLNTSQLFSGKYQIRLKVYTGKNLEKLFLKDITLKVNADFSPVYLLAGIIGSIILVTIIISKVRPSTAHMHHSMAERLRILGEKLDRSKAELDLITQKTEKFIDDSNEWIIRTHGEEYAFK